MKYWQTIDLTKPKAVSELEEEDRGAEKYFEAPPEVQAYFDVPIADEPVEEYVINLFEWGTEPEAEDRKPVGESKTPTECVGA